MPEFDSDTSPTASRGTPAPPFRPRLSEDAALDTVIVQRMAQGDESSLGALYDRWADGVHALVVRIVRDEAEAEEVVEAVFWQAWQQAGRYTGDRGTPGAWLLAMARSRAIDRLRALRRRRDEVATSDEVLSNAAAVGDPLSDLSSRERAGRVATALATLPVEQRTVLEMAYFEGLSQTEIAERLVQPLGTVKTRARLALRKLRDTLSVLREELAS